MGNGRNVKMCREEADSGINRCVTEKKKKFLYSADPF
jgi:hypothetical protein